MTDTPTGETGGQETVSNNTTPVTAPAADNSNAELERLRKEKEQADMRANQLANELEKRKQDEADARARKLEEEGKLREALELERDKSRRLEEEKEAAERNARLTKGTEEVLAKYNPAVIEIAKTAGLSLVDDSDEAKASLEEKLNKIAGNVGGTGRVEANNGPITTPAGEPKDALIGAMGDPSLRPYQRDAAAKKYISGLEAVKQMKQSVGYPTE